jgi:hypothetical protein
VVSLEGTATGSAWLPATAGGSAAPEAQGGSATLQRLPNGTWLVLDCPQGCSFHAGTATDDPGRSLGVDLNRLSDARVAGTLRATHTLWSCSRLPVVVGLAFGRSDCVRCYSAVLEATPDGHLQGGPGPAC